MRYTCIGTIISTDTESHWSSFPSSQPAVITYKNHQQSLKPVDICNHLSLLWSCVTDHHETVSHHQIPWSIKPPCICSIWAESPKHVTAIAGTVRVMSQQVCCFLTADGKHLLWQHWLGCGRYCETWVSWCVIQCSYYSAKMINEFTVHVSRSE